MQFLNKNLTKLVLFQRVQGDLERDEVGERGEQQDAETNHEDDEEAEDDGVDAKGAGSKDRRTRRRRI